MNVNEVDALKSIIQVFCCEQAVETILKKKCPYVAKYSISASIILTVDLIRIKRHFQNLFHPFFFCLNSRL